MLTTRTWALRSVGGGVRWKRNLPFGNSQIGSSPLRSRLYVPLRSENRDLMHRRASLHLADRVRLSVKVSGKRNPKVSGGAELFLRAWDISEGTLEPRGYVFKLPESAFSLKKEAWAGSKGES